MNINKILTYNCIAIMSTPQNVLLDNFLKIEVKNNRCYGKYKLLLNIYFRATSEQKI